MKGRSLSEQVFSATAWNTLLLPARLLVGLCANVIYYQVLSREEVGIVFLLTSLATTLGLFADLGLERTLPRFLPEAERHAGRAGVRELLQGVIRVKLALLLVVVAALAFLADPVVTRLVQRERAQSDRLMDAARSASSNEQRDARLAEATVKRALAEEMAARGDLFLGAVGLLVVLGAFFDVNMQFLTANFRQKSWTLITLVNTLLQPVLVSAFVLLGYGVPGVLTGIVLTPLFALSLALPGARRVEASLPAGPASGRLPRSLRERFVRYAAVDYVQQMSTWLYDLDVIVFLSAATLGLKEAALLGFAYKFSRDLLGYVWTPLTGVMTPLLSRVRARDSTSALDDAQASLTRLVWLLLVPACVGATLLAPRVIPLLYPKYSEAVSLVVLFLIFAFVDSMFAVPQVVLMVCERYRPVLFARLLAVSAIPLVAWLLPTYGIYGVALAVGMARLSARGFSVFAGVRSLGLHLPWRFGGRVGVATTGMALLVVTLRGLLPLHPVEVAGRIAALLCVVGLALLGATTFALALRHAGGLAAVDGERLERLKFPGKQVLLALRRR